MALLNSSTLVPSVPSSAARGRLLRRLAVLSLMLGAGCALVSALSRTPPYGFSHRVHAAEGLECADCHAGALQEDAPGMPVQSQCVLCHEEIDAKKPPERRIATLFDGQAFRAARPNHLAAEVVFSHKQHTAKQADCKACHAAIESDEFVGTRRTVTMTSCVDCHAEQGTANECATCHREQRLDRAPASHAFGWDRLHGRMFRGHDLATANQCSLCHQESACASCHQEQAPKNHNDYFRRRGHGLHARMDRQNCSACHRSDSCDSCHQESRPISHRGSFGAPLDTHCVSCHFPLATTDCATCHLDTPSHTLATALPPDHTAGMNCRQCHGLSAPMPHVDNGSECSRCHR